MNTCPGKNTHDPSETTTAVPKQYSVPLTRSKEGTATRGFSSTFLPNLTNSATALTEQITGTAAVTTSHIVETIPQVGADLPQPTVDGSVQQPPLDSNASALGRFLEELSWCGVTIRNYRDGGRGYENVLTTEVLQGLDLLPRSPFLENGALSPSREFV
jgi:hypothetical protein